jgi:hypothetical protein
MDLRKSAGAGPGCAGSIRARTIRVGAAWVSGLVSVLAWACTPAAAADGCTQPSTPIQTDRPDVTNSSIVVPVGSLQSENGVNVSRREGAGILDGTNSRLRLGLAPCFEMLVDLPNEVRTFRGTGNSGFGDVAPAFKWQISPVPGKFDLSVVLGAALPTGSSAIAGPGVQPYLQLPWSVELGRGWGISGMVTNFFMPDDPVNRFTNQSTFVIEKEIGERSFLFVEYVGDFPANGATSQLFNSGGGYRITDTQQIDFHVGFGLNHEAPAYVFGVGYSFRLDGLFKRP